jgi:hypothetical protein
LKKLLHVPATGLAPAEAINQYIRRAALKE